jgi:hypothetical protein
MNTPNRNTSSIQYPFLLAALVSTGAWATQPPDVVASDGSGNTAMGTSALQDNYAYQNTAAGYQALLGNSSGYSNAAFGWQALINNTGGIDNTAVGSSALTFNGNGNYNVAVGQGALYKNSGSNNTASGWWALNQNSTGYSNTATGDRALYANTTGTYNTATGALALFNNSSNSNTADGYSALYNNTSGTGNSAFGTYALFSNVDGEANTASGYKSLYSNLYGAENTAFGIDALYQLIDGSSNTAIGRSALQNATGTGNIALGASAGNAVAAGNWNIEIGSPGYSGDTQTIRIGTPGTHTATFISGINNSKVTGAAVYVTSSGQLGVLASSERYKTSIASMGANSEKLARLRPVTFHLKTEPQGALQYGLIAEEVEHVYPELVIRGADGRIEGVRYDELAPLLLNEFQQQRRSIAAMSAQIASQNATIATLNEDHAQVVVQARALQQMRRDLGKLRSLAQSMQTASLR